MQKITLHPMMSDTDSLANSPVNPRTVLFVNEVTYGIL